MILVIGDVMIDTIVAFRGEMAQGTDTPARIVQRAGGSAANIACWLGHLGADVAFAGRVGADDAAAQAEALRIQGVRPHLAGDAARATGRTVAIVDATGERSFYTDRGANLDLCHSDLPDSLLDGVRAVHVSGHAMMQPGSRAAVLALLPIALARGCKVSADAGSRAWLEAAGPACFADWIAGADTCFANAAEAALLRPVWRGATLVVTRGADGADAFQGAEAGALHVAARAVAVADGIGAGDAFVAGFLCARAGGAGLAGCLEAGVAAASLALATPGGRPERAISEAAPTARSR